MAEEMKNEAEVPTPVVEAPAAAAVETPKAESVAPPPPAEEKPDETKALAVVEIINQYDPAGGSGRLKLSIGWSVRIRSFQIRVLWIQVISDYLIFYWVESDRVVSGEDSFRISEAPEPAPKKLSGGSHDRDAALVEVEKEKRLSFVRAWEESEKSKAENKSQKKLSVIIAWENNKKAALEAKLRKIEEQLEKKKAEYAEKMKNKVALLHKEAEEKRAMVEAKRGEELLKAEEMAAKYRATGQTPKKGIGCF